MWPGGGVQSHHASLLCCRVEFWHISTSEQYCEVIYLTELSGMTLMISIKCNSYWTWTCCVLDYQRKGWVDTWRLLMCYAFCHLEPLPDFSLTLYSWLFSFWQLLFLLLRIQKVVYLYLTVIFKSCISDFGYQESHKSLVMLLERLVLLQPWLFCILCNWQRFKGSLKLLII